jgi:hypothetical protein
MGLAEGTRSGLLASCASIKHLVPARPPNTHPATRTHTHAPVCRSMSEATNLALPQTAPAMMSDAPLTNLVSECTTTSAPHAAGVTASGVNVLSTTSDAPQPCASAASAGRSATTSVGFETVSQYSTLVAGVSAAATAARSVTSTKVTRMLHLSGRKVFMSAHVPPYTQLLHTMWSPALHSARTALEMAPMPARARACGMAGAGEGYPVAQLRGVQLTANVPRPQRHTATPSSARGHLRQPRRLPLCPPSPPAGGPAAARWGCSCGHTGSSRLRVGCRTRRVCATTWLGAQRSMHRRTQDKRSHLAWGRGRACRRKCPAESWRPALQAAYDERARGHGSGPTDAHTRVLVGGCIAPRATQRCVVCLTAQHVCAAWRHVLGTFMLLARSAVVKHQQTCPRHVLYRATHNRTQQLHEQQLSAPCTAPAVALLACKGGGHLNGRVDAAMLAKTGLTGCQRQPLNRVLHHDHRAACAQTNKTAALQWRIRPYTICPRFSG